MENKKTDVEQYLKVPEWAAPYDEKMTMLLTGKIKIQELPLNERASLYIFAIRYARDVCQDKDMAYMEKRLIEQQLLNDIIEVRAAGDKAREEDLFRVFRYYFLPYTANAYEGQHFCNIWDGD